ncbi:hypothetical protein QFC22_006122 [Naganishia vaughanmartiniae]|uniref:Uncharacterized protein n=1 Tax=Naganishia vaughanmartiniae TaxID=1424756 RepID=A0ACC2WPK6_9TREE|nr:hypothetical protein QFC22_006122 [Naganishia vaughanmartiniae]
MLFPPFHSRKKNGDDGNDGDKKKRKYSPKDVLMTFLLFSLPAIATFLQLLTFISGPGARYWTVIVHTEGFGVVRVGSLGICLEPGPCRSGLGYQTGPKFGGVIPRFAAAGVWHFVVFWLLIIATVIHFFRLKSLHKDREKGTRWTCLIWAIPAFSAFLLLLCIVVDWALISALQKDGILKRTKQGVPIDGAVKVGGCVWLTVGSLLLVCVWFCVSLRVWWNSPKDFEQRLVLEEKVHEEELQERAKNNQKGMYGLFTGWGGATDRDGERQQHTAAAAAAGGGGGVGGMISNMFGGWGSDPNGPPKFNAYD